MMRRTHAAGSIATFTLACALAIGAGSSCSSGGSYSLTWKLQGTTGTPTAWDCASHGIGTVLVAISQGGMPAGTDTFPCDTQPGVGSLPSGTYDFTVVGGDFMGNPLLAPVVKKGIVVNQGQTTTIAVTLAPLPQCSNGIDDDDDGLIDLADPGCAGDPMGNDEAAK